MPGCSIVSCRARKKKTQPELTLHRFPKNERLKKKWMDSIGEGNMNPLSKDWFICSLHFEEKCFNRTLDVIRLRENSVPTIFSPEANKQSKKQENTKLVKKKIVPVRMLKRITKPAASKQAKISEVPESTPKIAGNSPIIQKRPEFECPVCSERFPVYFTTFRHIQKKHCVNDKGEKVSTHAPDLVKPIRIESCASCSLEIRSTEPHNCPRHHSNKDQFSCLGCHQTFTGLILFQHHVKGLHADGTQNYFFPTRDDFMSWKTDLEEQTNVKFVKLNKTKSKEIYHCSHQDLDLNSTTEMCCSLITVREYTKGIHACYYKEHNGHTVDSSPLAQHTQYSISLYMQDTEEMKVEAAEDNELFMQFKKMISCILFDAAKVSGNTVKELLGKALEMTSILKHSEGQDRGIPLISKCLTDAQISRTLDSLKADQNKRKIQDETVKVTPVAKRARKSSLPVEKVLENGVAKKHKNSSALNKASSFTENLNDNEEIENIVEPVVQEKIVTKQKSVTKKTELPVTPEKKEDDRTNKIIEDPQPIAALRTQVQSPSSFNDSYKNFVDQNFKVNTEKVTSTPKSRANVKKKEVVKTKMGQFKVKTSVSPKTVSPKLPKEVKLVREVEQEVPATPRIRKPVADIQYEVKEQENDCNILILKI